MNEVDKIEEARYFLERMRETASDERILKHNLSAFLSASRSVLQYAKHEAETTDKKLGRQWYDGIVTGQAVIKILKEKRDENIHQGQPARSRQEIGVKLYGNMPPATGSIGFPEPSREPYVPPPERPAEVTYHRHYLADWTGPEDLFEVCELYLLALQASIADGIESDWLKG